MLLENTKLSESLNSFLSSQNYSKVFVLVDENTLEHCYSFLKLIASHQIIEIKSGEKNKTLDTCQLIWSYLLESNADRNSVLINLGGGVITDMGGFCASTYKRGIDFINIPTTLLAQVDASTGSKTGIDFSGQKNMIGLFSEPKKVFIHTAFLKTLPERELKSGFAEVLKHGFILDENYLTESFNSFTNGTIDWKKTIAKSVEIKTYIVSKDPKEKGLRKILNFGHTIGHALESYSLENHSSSILHGEAIVLGMIAELYLSYKKEFISKENLDLYIENLLSIYSFKNIENFGLQEVLNLCANDKKNQNQKIKMVLLKEIGNATYDQEINNEEVLDSLHFLIKTIENA